GLVGRLEDVGDFLDDATMERLNRKWQRLLERIIAAPAERLSQLSLVSASEQQQMLEEWNDTATGYEPATVMELIERQAQQRRDAVAVVYESEMVSYGELERRANQLGNYLQGLGVGAEVRVGLFVERSLAMMVGMLGILKAGGAYVQLESSYPASRLGYVLAEAGVGAVLTERKLQAKLARKWAQGGVM